MRFLHLLIMSAVLAATSAIAAPPAAPPPAAAVSAAPKPAAGSDEAREALIAKQLRAIPGIGEPVELTVAGKPVFALFEADRSARRQGAVVLIHDVGRHPDWPGVIDPLRRRLALHGWDTLSLQAPLPAAGSGPEAFGALLDLAKPRIAAAIQYLAGRGAKNIVLIGHGLGATMAVAYAADGGQAVKGLVLVGMGRWRGGKLDPRLDPANLIKRIAVPVLDIYGSGDLPPVTGSAAARLAAVNTKLLVEANDDPRKPLNYDQLKPGARLYSQRCIDGADHDFSGQGDVLLRQVWGWLRRNGTGTTVGELSPPGTLAQ